MSSSERAGLSGGTIFLVVEFSWPWPPRLPMRSQTQLIDCIIYLDVGYGDRIRVQIFHTDGTIFRQAVSCPLIVYPNSTGILCIRWDGVRGIQIDIGEHNVTYPYIMPWFVVEEISVNGDGPFSFDSKNLRSLDRRKSKRTRGHAKQAAANAGDAYLIEALKEEANQLSDLLDLVHSGRMSHVRGLAARLRLLLVRDGQNPLLQSVAAISDVPLMVYTNGNPTLKLSLAPSIAFGLAPIASTPTRLCQNPIDIDVWLNLAGLQIEDEIISNHDLIADIGNTIGAHLDVNVSSNVIILKGTKVMIDGATLSELERYLIRVAKVVNKLANHILATMKIV